MFYHNFFEKIRDLNGRSNRLDFWSLWIATGLLLTVLYWLDLQLGLDKFEYMGFRFGYLYVLGFLITLYPNLAIEIRRLNDLKISPWWLGLHIIPGLGWLILLIIYMFPSRK